MVRNIRISSMAAVFVLGIATAGAASAQAAPTGQDGWYGGLDISRSHLGLSGSNIDRAFAGQGITSTSSLDRSRGAWGADLGYRFGRNFALEGGYTDLGKFNYSSAATAPGIDTERGAFKAHAWWLAPVGIVPLADGWSLIGKAGLTRVSESMTASSSTGATAPNSLSGSNTGWLVGVGTTYDINRSVFAKLEWDRYGRVGIANATGRGDADQLGIGVGVHF
jgi:OmpA-OmpF porin, OOP family